MDWTVTNREFLVFGCMADATQTFPEVLASHQQRLLGYVISILGDADSAWDVLQETNRVLLEKRDDFQPGTSFLNWALTVAQFQTMAWLRNQKRSRLIVTADIAELLADDAVTLEAKATQAQTDALKSCLESLTAGHRELVHLRYARSLKLADLAEQTGRSVNALKQLFFRLRASLASCIEQRLEA